MQKELYDIYFIDDQGFIFNKHENKQVAFRFNKNNKTCYINLYVNKVKKTFILHILVAKTFIKDYNQKSDIIRHKDNNPLNNALSNLEVYRYKKIFPKEDE